MVDEVVGLGIAEAAYQLRLRRLIAAMQTACLIGAPHSLIGAPACGLLDGCMVQLQDHGGSDHVAHMCAHVWQPM